MDYIYFTSTFLYNITIAAVTMNLIVAVAMCLLYISCVIMPKTPSLLHLPLYMRPVRWRSSFTTSSPSPSPKSGTWKMAEFIKVKIQDTSEKVNLTFSKVSLTFFEINRRWNGVFRNFYWQIKYKSGVRSETEGEP